MEESIVNGRMIRDIMQEVHECLEPARQIYLGVGTVEPFSLYVSAGMDIARTKESLTGLLEYKKRLCQEMLKHQSEIDHKMLAATIKDVDNLIMQVLGIYRPC